MGKIHASLLRRLIALTISTIATVGAAQTFTATDLGSFNLFYQHSNEGFGGINDAGTIVGVDTVTDQAASYRNGTITDLGVHGYASGINNAGTIVGQNLTTGLAFSYSNGTVNGIGTLGGDSSSALGINDGNVIVGAANLTGNTSFHAVSSSHGVLTDLGTLRWDEQRCDRD